jgi:hypothetical protein
MNGLLRMVRGILVSTIYTRTLELTASGASGAAYSSGLSRLNRFLAIAQLVVYL